MRINSETEMLNFGKKIAKTIAEDHRSHPNSSTVIELVGDVGAGKTTFAKGLATGLGVKEQVTSPSFTISKTYAMSKGKLIHYDYYRLPDPGIMIDDFTESIQSPDNIIVVEWGESITNFLPQDHLIISISYNDDNTREVITNLNKNSLRKRATKNG